MLGDRVIRTSFILSVIGHSLFLGMPGFNPSLPQAERCEEITVQIEIEKPPLLPKIEVMGEEKKIVEVVEEPEIEPPVEVVVEEPVEKFETSEEKTEIVEPAQEAMFRYQDMVKQKIEEVRRYPPWAKRHGIEGEALIKFAILSNGLCRDIEIIRSSGSKILDGEAVDTVKRASPFPPVPEEIDSSLVRMELSIVFTLKYEK